MIQLWCETTRWHSRGTQQRNNPPGLPVRNSAKAGALGSSCQHPSLSANLTLEKDDLEHQLWRRRKPDTPKPKTPSSCPWSTAWTVGSPSCHFYMVVLKKKKKPLHWKLGTKGLHVMHTIYYKWPRDDGWEGSSRLLSFMGILTPAIFIVGTWRETTRKELSQPLLF